MFPNLKEHEYFVLDTETTGLTYPVDRVFGVSIALPHEETFYWDIRRTPSLFEWLNDSMRRYKGKIVAHHAKFDWLMCRCSGIKLPESRLIDTMTTAVLIDEHLYEYSLDALCIFYELGQKKTLPSKARMQDLPFDQVSEYARHDALLTLKLHKWQQEEIERQGLHDIVNFEHTILPTICRANARGIRVDLDRAEKAITELTPIIENKKLELNQLVGKEVNVNSGPQIKKIFEPQLVNDEWVANDGTTLGTTDKGGPSIGSEYLMKMKHPAAPLILEVRSLLKTQGTFLEKHILGHEVGGRVYPTINQNKGEDGGTGTGRLSYVNPAMQQIPSRNEKVAAIVKSCFLPEEGCKWVDSDQASFEVRVFIHLVNNQKMIEAYHKNPELDGHQFVADLTGLPRKASYSGQPNAKQLNLSMIFNSGNGAIAEEMGMPWTWDQFMDPHGQIIRYRKASNEAMAVINHYHENMPGVKELASRAKETAKERGHVKTFTGRRLRFPDKRYCYKASGLLIQATAADINKRTWLHIEQALEGDGCLTLNTHDSYGMSIKESVLMDRAKKVKYTVETNNVLRVPVILEVSPPGDNWWDSANGERML